MQAVHHHVRQRILKAPAGAVFVPMDFLDLAGRAAIDQALSRMVRAGALERLARGLYHVPRINAALGVAVPPDPDQIAQAIGRRTNSRVVASEAVIANRAGLTTQVPIRMVYLTSGRSRVLSVGSQTVELRHAPRWQLELPASRAGQAIRAFAWFGRERAVEAAQTIRGKLSAAELQSLTEVQGRLPGWVAEQVSALAHA
jgi:hypothetical protein